MTLKEYRLRLKAYELQIVDKEYWVHLQAYLNFSVRATRGKRQIPVYRNFKQFFDYKKELQKFQDPKEKEESETIKRLRDYMVKKGGVKHG